MTNEMMQSLFDTYVTENEKFEGGTRQQVLEHVKR